MPEEKILKVKWSDVRTRGRIDRFCKKYIPEIESSDYENSILRQIIDQCRKYYFHDIRNSGFYKYSIIDNVMWRPLDRASYPFLCIEINKKKKDKKNNFTKSDKKFIFERYGFKVFNKNDCFSTNTAYYTSGIYVINEFCKGIYGSNEKWMESYGGIEEVSKIISQYDPKFLDSEFSYKKRHTIEMNHFPMQKTIANLFASGYPKYDKYLAVPIHSMDHAKLTKCKNEKEQLEIFIEEGWMTKEEAKEFCNKIMKRVLEIEKERELEKKNSLSKLLKSQFSFIFD